MEIQTIFDKCKALYDGLVQNKAALDKEITTHKEATARQAEFFQTTSEQQKVTSEKLEKLGVDLASKEEELSKVENIVELHKEAVRMQIKNKDESEKRALEKAAHNKLVAQNNREAVTRKANLDDRDRLQNERQEQQNERDEKQKDREANYKTEIRKEIIAGIE